MREEPVTELLRQWAEDDEAARDRAVELVHAELVRLARTYLRLGGLAEQDWKSRAQFFAVSSQIMRQVLVDYARRHRASKRGAGVALRSFDETLGTPANDSRGLDLLAVHEALTQLQKLSLRTVKVLEWQYFGRLTVPEVASALGVADSSVNRELKVGKIWVRDFLVGGLH